MESPAGGCASIISHVQLLLYDRSYTFIPRPNKKNDALSPMQRIIVLERFYNHCSWEIIVKYSVKHRYVRYGLFSASYTSSLRMIMLMISVKPIIIIPYPQYNLMYIPPTWFKQIWLKAANTGLVDSDLFIHVTNHKYKNIQSITRYIMLCLFW